VRARRCTAAGLPRKSGAGSELEIQVDLENVHRVGIGKIQGAVGITDQGRGAEPPCVGVVDGANERIGEVVGEAESDALNIEGTEGEVVVVEVGVDGIHAHAAEIRDERPVAGVHVLAKLEAGETCEVVNGGMGGGVLDGGALAALGVVGEIPIELGRNAAELEGNIAGAVMRVRSPVML